MRPWVLGIAALLLLLGVSARTLLAAGVVSRVPTTERVVALTFDDGPEEPYTAQILRLLRENHATATFFVLGDQVLKHPALIQQERRDHMEVALHGMTHLNLFRVGAAYLVRDALQEQALLTKMVPGTPIALFRPPYGNRNPALQRLLSEHHMELVLWDVDTRDWARPGVSFIVHQVETMTHPGSIVLFHDGGGNRRQTVEALRHLLPWFRRQGYQLVTVRQLLARAGT